MCFQLSANLTLAEVDDLDLLTKSNQKQEHKKLLAKIYDREQFESLLSADVKCTLGPW